MIPPPFLVYVYSKGFSPSLPLEDQVPARSRTGVASMGTMTAAALSGTMAGETPVITI